ncbi:MAG: zinc ribbon domain-containing protein [Lachnospiraceae bacterium]|nr:zinc ribbon domain-containing protein [Lachnospiraceae bacterium]
MKYCKQCNLKIADPTNLCPLCQSILETEGGKEQPKEAMYPMVSQQRKGYNLILRIFAFLCLIAMVVLAIVNYFTYDGLMWSIICDAAILYLLVTLRYTLFNGHEGHTMKILMQVIAVMMLTILIDHTLGYQGWSVTYALPTIILVADVLVLILMLVNLRTWQSYILLQIGMMILSAALGLYMLFCHIEHTMLAGIAIGVSVVIFLGTVCIGDVRARNEIKRRFHV